MVFFRRSKTSAGLDVGSGYLKLVVVDHSGPEPQVVRASSSRLVPDAIVEGEIMDPALVAETIRSLVSDREFRRSDVVAAVGGHDVIIKQIRMDRMAEEDARDVIRWEAEQHVPFDMESVQLDFQILDPEGTESQMSVLLVAAKRELVENRMALLADAGLDVAVVDVDAFALFNAFEWNYGNDAKGLVGLVHVGHESTNLNLLADGVPILVRDIPFGSRRMRETLQRERGLSAEEADALMEGRANGSGDLPGFVADRAEELALGIERAAAFFTAQAANTALDRLVLSGGGARVPGLVDAVGRRLGVPCEIMNPFERLAVRPDVFETVDLDEVAPMLTLAVGLALRRAN